MYSPFVLNMAMIMLYLALFLVLHPKVLLEWSAGKVRVLPFVQNHFPKVAYMERKKSNVLWLASWLHKEDDVLLLFRLWSQTSCGEEPISNVIQNDSLELQSFYTVNRGNSNTFHSTVVFACSQSGSL